jgi:hypothetical protein
MVTFPLVTLVAHRGEHLVPFGYLTKYPALSEVVRPRLLAESMKTVPSRSLVFFSFFSDCLPVRAVLRC